MLADFDPGTLTGFYIVFFSGGIVALCLLGALVLFLAKQGGAARTLATVAGGVFCLAVFGVLLDIFLVKVLHWHVL